MPTYRTQGKRSLNFLSAEQGQISARQAGSLSERFAIDTAEARRARLDRDVATMNGEIGRSWPKAARKG
jgi:hypothetical protein